MKMVNVKVIILGLLSVFLIVSTFITTTQAASVDRKRAANTICSPGARCGWYVYNKTTRNLEDPHKACSCPDDEQCVRTEDDVSVSAYVYRCKSTPKPEDTNMS